MTVLVLSNQVLTTLIGQANLSPRGRQHKNLHSSYSDSCQRFLNAVAMDSYIPPHRHSLDPKVETLIAIRGLFALITFDDNGNILKIVKFGSEKYHDLENMGVGVELSPETWHTVVALAPDSILFELKAGPFDPQAAKELAQWAPEEKSEEAKKYLEELRRKVLSDY